jgi:hypothetical protein
MGAVLLTSVELQEPHRILGLACGRKLAEMNKGSWRMDRMGNILGTIKGSSLWLEVYRC